MRIFRTRAIDARCQGAARLSSPRARPLYHPPFRWLVGVTALAHLTVAGDGDRRVHPQRIPAAAGGAGRLRHHLRHPGWQQRSWCR